MKTPTSYADAQAELEALLTKLRSADLDVDHIGTAVARAKALIEWSQERLRKTEGEINTLFGEDSQ